MNGRKARMLRKEALTMSKNLLPLVKYSETNHRNKIITINNQKIEIMTSTRLLDGCVREIYQSLKKRG